MVGSNLRPLVWVRSSKKDFAEFPEEVQDVVGYALHRVQIGRKKIENVKPLNQGSLKGLGIYEVANDFDSDTYRTVYTVELEGVVYVLHAFKKKSKHGISTPAHVIELIRSRYDEAVRIHAEASER